MKDQSRNPLPPGKIDPNPSCSLSFQPNLPSHIIFPGLLVLGGLPVHGATFKLRPAAPKCTASIDPKRIRRTVVRAC